MDRAVERGDWERARIAARRVVRAAERVATAAPLPPALAAAAARVRAAAQPGDRDAAAFEAAIANGDFEMAALLGEQLVAAGELAAGVAPAEEPVGWKVWL